MNQNVKPTIFVILIGICLLCLGLLLWSQRPDSTEDPATQPGYAGVITVKLVAKTRVAAYKMIEAGDINSVVGMTIAGDVLSIPSSTPAVLIEKGTAVTHLRMTDGPYQGDECWVPNGLFK